MTRRRDTYDAAAPQLTLAGVPGPEAQGTMFDRGEPVATRRVIEIAADCVTCGATVTGPVETLPYPVQCQDCADMALEAGYLVDRCALCEDADLDDCAHL